MLRSFLVLFSCCVVFCVGYNSECGPNQVMSCELPCPPEKSCSNHGIQINCLDVVVPCENRCVCKDGLYRNDVGDCVTNDHCGPSCAENEVYADCKKSCPPDLCFSLIAKFKCDSNEPCQQGCVCKPGYLRKQLDSPCEPICQCPEMKNSPDCVAS